MKAEQAKEGGKVELPCAILIRVDAIDAFERCEDPEGLGRIIFLVLAWLRGESRPLPGDATPGTEYMFDQMCETARRGVDSCRKRTDSAKKAAAARNDTGRRPKGAERGKPTPVSSPASGPESLPKRMPDAPDTPAGVQPKGRGEVMSVGDCLDGVVGGGGGHDKGGETFAERVERDFLAATLEFTKEKETRMTHNVYNLYRSKLGEQYDEELIAAYSEANQGEWDGVRSRGAVFVERLKKLAHWN